MTKKYIILTGVAAIMLFYIPVLVLNNDMLRPLTEEDRFYESVGALFFFFASLAFLFIFLKGKKRNVFFLLFALAFFFAAGEEISWGQRIFNFPVPAVIEANNAQKEFNIHNLNFIQHENGIGSSLKGMLLNFNRLFILFWATYCILMPMANRYSERLRNIFLRIQLPIVSLWFGALFLLNEITSKTLEITVIHCQSNCPQIAEIKEALWGVLVFLWAVYFFFGYAASSSMDSQMEKHHEGI